MFLTTSIFSTGFTTIGHYISIESSISPGSLGPCFSKVLCLHIVPRLYSSRWYNNSLFLLPRDKCNSEV